jgi:hypothetical protein
MGTDQAANPGEGVVFPHHLPGLLMLVRTDQGQKTGDIDTGRTGQVARGGKELGADQGVAVLVQNMMFVLFPKITKRSEDRINGFLA